MRYTLYSLKCFMLGALCVFVTSCHPKRPSHGGAVANHSLQKSTTPSACDAKSRVHLYGARNLPTQIDLDWYKETGITDAWISGFEGAFIQDVPEQDRLSLSQWVSKKADLDYKKNDIKFWWFERPVPDFVAKTFVWQTKLSVEEFWRHNPTSDQMWQTYLDNIKKLYPKVQAAGFSGLVFDLEGYYNSSEDLWANSKPKDQALMNDYLTRGVSMGKAIASSWSGVKVYMVYGFGYPGEKQFMKGVSEGLGKQGTAIIGLEHTYGAGNGSLGSEWFQSSWEGRSLAETVLNKQRKDFSYLPNVENFIAGIFPVDFGKKVLNYTADDLAQQIQSARCGIPGHPIDVFIWAQGDYSKKVWSQVKNQNLSNFWGSLKK